MHAAEVIMWEWLLRTLFRRGPDDRLPMAGLGPEGSAIAHISMAALDNSDPGGTLELVRSGSSALGVVRKATGSRAFVAHARLEEVSAFKPAVPALAWQLLHAAAGTL